MNMENSDLLKETINFVENIEFSEFQPKTEIKEEEGLDQEVWKSSPFDVKPKLEQIETPETGEAKIKTEPEDFFSYIETETFRNESIEIKDEFMWAMKDFESDNVPPMNIEQRNVAVAEKKPTVRFTVKAGENDPRKNKKEFECALCPYKVCRKDHLNRHIAAVHEQIRTYIYKLNQNVTRQ